MFNSYLPSQSVQVYAFVWIHIEKPISQAPIPFIFHLNFSDIAPTVASRRHKPIGLVQAYQILKLGPLHLLIIDPGLTSQTRAVPVIIFASASIIEQNVTAVQEQEDFKPHKIK